MNHAATPRRIREDGQGGLRDLASRPSEDSRAGVVYRFDDCELDVARRELRVGGRPVACQPKAFELLRYLIEHRDRVVSKEELHEILWPDEIVSDWSITTCLRRVRRVLGAKSTDWIQTHRGRGLHFVAECAVTGSADDTPPQSASTNCRLVGREPQLRLLRQALADSGSGVGRTILLCGPAGIGKSALVGAVRSLADEYGMGFLDGAGYEGEGAPTCWVWTQILRAGGQEVGGAWKMGDGDSDLAGILPELRSSLRPREERDFRSPAAKLDAFRAVCRWLRQAATRSPLVVVIEDLHWADEVSVALLRYAVRDLRHSPVLLVATARDDHTEAGSTLAVELGRLRADPNVDVVPVSRLDTDAVGELVGSLLPYPVDADIRARIEVATNGIPLLIEQLVRHVGEVATSGEGRLTAIRAALDQGPAVGGGILERSLARLDVECRDVLRVASVLGVEFDRDDLVEFARAISGKSKRAIRTEVATALREALAARVLCRTAEGRGGCAFAHGLLRGALYSELSVEERGRLHALAAGLLERRRLQGGVPVTEIADHLVRAADFGSPRKAIDSSIEAAEECRRFGDSGRCVQFLAHAVRLADEYGSLPSARFAELLIGLASACADAGQTERARSVAARAVVYARRTRRPALFARAVLCSGRGIQPQGVVDTERIALLHEALTQLPEAEVSLRVALLNQLAWEHFYDPAGPAPRLERSRQATELARKRGTDGDLLDALEIGFWALQSPELLERQRTNIAERLDLAGRVGAEDRHGQALADLALVAFGMGDFRSAIDAGEELARRGRAGDRPRDYLRSLILRGIITSMRGDWESFRETIAEAVRLAQFVDEEVAAILPVNLLGERLACGDITVDTVEPWVAMMPQRPEVAINLALALVVHGEHERARTVLATHFAAGAAGLPKDARFLHVASSLGVVQARIGEWEGGAATYETLLPYETRHLVLGFRGGAFYSGSVRWPLGALAAALRRWDAAESHLRLAAAECRAHGARPLLAQVLTSHAEMLAARGRAKDKPRLERFTGEAARIAAEVGLKGVERRLVALGSAGG